MQRIVQFWKSGTAGKLAIGCGGCGGFAGLLFICVVCGTLFGQGTTREEVATATPTMAIPKTATVATAKATETPTTAIPKTETVATAKATQTPAATKTPPSTVVEVPAYDIASLDDVSVGNSIRFRVVVTTEFPVSTVQINSVCAQVVENLKIERPFNAVAVFLFDTRSLLSTGYSIAKCEYAPNGEWADAAKVQTGDYSTHSFAYGYMPKVSEPEGALVDRPTEEEHDLCQQWDALVFELLSSGIDASTAENRAFEQVSEDNGVSVPTVNDAVLKCVAWTWR